MPRTIQEVLDHADELAKKFEDFDPAQRTERPVSEYLLQRAALARARTERQIFEAVEAVEAVYGLTDSHGRRPVRSSARPLKQLNRVTAP